MLTLLAGEQKLELFALYPLADLELRGNELL
jgi:hypothetical protein